MDTHPDDGKADRQITIDPLQRVLVPRERRMTNGHLTFMTQDKQQYVRDARTGVIRRVRRAS